LRVICGLAFVTVITVIESWLNSQAANTERGRLFAAHMVTNLGALAIAQQALRLGSPEEFTLFAIAAVLICWAVITLFFAWGGLSFSLYPLAVVQLIDQLHPDKIISGTADMLVLHDAGCAAARILNRWYRQAPKR